MNSQKYIGKAFLLVCSLGAMLSCRKSLELTPETDLSDAVFWQNTEQLKFAANNLYTFIPSEIGGAYDDNKSDIAYGKAANSISDGSRIAPSTDGPWTDNYRLIRRANTIIEKSAGVAGDKAIIDKYVGEAYFFRALAYFELVKRYGDVPLVLQTFDVDDPLIMSPRAPRETVFDQIYKDLDQSITMVPEIDVQPAAEYGRITKGAGYALKSRAGLFEGTRQKFHSYGTPSKHLQISIAASLALMNGNKYALFTYTPRPDTSYFYLFQPAGEGKANKENILPRIYGQNVTNDVSSHTFPVDASNGSTSPTRALMDAYLYKDGLPLDKSPLAVPQTNTLSQFQDRDPRMYMTVFSKNEFRISALYVPRFDQNQPTGYLIRKYEDLAEARANTRGFLDYQFLRYGEVLLNYAEAVYELGNAISDADLNLSLNKVRARATMPALTNAFVTSNGLSMRTEIRRERTIEFAFEGFRLWDLYRWKTAEIELTKEVAGSKYYPAEHGTVTQVRNAEGYAIMQAASLRKFNPAKDYLYPIPTQELGLNPNIKQNPGW